MQSNASRTLLSSKNGKTRLKDSSSTKCGKPLRIEEEMIIHYGSDLRQEASR